MHAETDFISSIKMFLLLYLSIIMYFIVFIIGRGKPGWGRESTRPPWWPNELPWANVRMDARCEDEKQKVGNYL